PRLPVQDTTSRSTTRCTNIRPSREYSTISPLEISDTPARWTEIRSPGCMEGTMLVPKTRRRTSPNVRTTSPAKPHACAATFSREFISALTAGYEAFLLLRQLAWEVKTLPHASADTSNTGSNRNEGVLYGFFVGEAASSRGLPLLELSRFKCCAPC